MKPLQTSRFNAVCLISINSGDQMKDSFFLLWFPLHFTVMDGKKKKKTPITFNRILFSITPSLIQVMWPQRCWVRTRGLALYSRRSFGLGVSLSKWSSLLLHDVLHNIYWEPTSSCPWPCTSGHTIITMWRGSLEHRCLKENIETVIRHLWHKYCFIKIASKQKCRKAKAVVLLKSKLHVLSEKHHFLYDPILL